MARIELAPEIIEDFDRIIDHLERHEARNIGARLRAIIAAIDILERNPLIGRPTVREIRELIIGRDARGYISLYRYLPELDTVLVLAIRGQREAGYAR
ncbi:MAG: type II toxin-antitoxin system RelE/ParE family toxin [Rhodanobacteraceae bacterium]